MGALGPAPAYAPVGAAVLMGNLSRKDLNHYDIRDELRRNTLVADVSRHEGLGCDLIARHVVGGYPIFLEVKGPRSRERLTESEVALRAMFPANYFVVTTVAEAMAAVGLPPDGQGDEGDEGSKGGGR